MIDFDDLEFNEQTRKCRRVAFVDFWPGFHDNTDRWVSKRWFEDNLVDIEFVHPLANPAVVIFSVFGDEHVSHLEQGCSKLVFFTGENVRPPIRRFPLCLSFDRLPHVPRSTHSRLPLWVLDRELQLVLRCHEARLAGKDVHQATIHRAGFCSWVASNAAEYDASVRLSFVKLLSEKHQQVSCGGRVLNNVGGPVVDKLAFLRSYKFNIAFENASHPGYCTEKILHAFAAGCIPIYWGDPAIVSQNCDHGGILSGDGPDFNPAALISAHDFSNFEELAEHVARVDEDPELFQSYLRQPILSAHWYSRLRDWPAFRRSLTDLLLDGAEAWLQRGHVDGD